MRNTYREKAIPFKKSYWGTVIISYFRYYCGQVSMLLSELQAELVTPSH